MLYKVIGGPQSPMELYLTHDGIEPAQKIIKIPMSKELVSGETIHFQACYELIAGAYYYMSDNPENETSNNIMKLP